MKAVARSTGQNTEFDEVHSERAHAVNTFKKKLPALQVITVRVFCGNTRDSFHNILFTGF
jgi:hypothetical protein